MKLTFRKGSAADALEPRVSIPEVWSDEKGIAVRGWILTPNGPPTSLQIVIDGRSIPVVAWHARPKLIEKHPEFRSGENCGFWAYLPTTTKHQIEIRAVTHESIFSKTVTISGQRLNVAEARDSALLQRFCARVNQARLNVLEIGSRIVVPGSESKRALFPNAASYTGFDFYPDGNTDVVGDAHKLSSYFATPFDAVFSLAVLEHLAMPWLVALEINKVLRPGGITFHQTHFACPLHEQPADYWRFTDQGLRSLFSPVVGFAEAECEFFEAVALHPAHRTPELLHLPSQPAHLQVAVLATKAAEVNEEKTRWSCELSDAASVQYPAPAQYE